MTDLRAAVEGLLGEGCGGWGCEDERADERAAVLGLIPEGSVLVTEESLAEAIAALDVEMGIDPNEDPPGVRREYAAAIMARLRE